MAPMPPLVAAMERPGAPLPPVSVQQPILLTSFSYDAEKRQHFDDSSKRWYHEPPTRANQGLGTGVPADLNYGSAAFHDKPHVPDPLDSVLAALRYRAAQPATAPIVLGAPCVPSENLENELLRANVVTWRGIMTKLCTAWSCHVQAPPQFREGFELNVMMLGDTLFIEERPPDVYELAQRAPKSRAQERATYYGYSFESYCTQTTPSSLATEVRQQQPDAFSSSEPVGWGGEVNTNVQWCHIVKTRLGDSRVIIGGEVDCVETLPNDASGAPREGVVELKTNVTLRDAQDEMKLSVKMLRMYMQSFLLGVRTVVVGFRDARGTLESHRAYRTLDLPRAVRDKPGQWNANHNLSFGSAILSFLRREVAAQTERWLLAAGDRIRQGEAAQGPYDWRAHRSSSSFLCHLPLPSTRDAELDYPVFRLRYEPPFTHLTLQYVPPPELQADGRREQRCGIVPSDFYEWVTGPMPTA